MAKDMIANFLKKKIPKHIELAYKNVQVNVLKGNIEFEKISLDFYERDSSLLQTNVQIDQLTIDDFGYWDFFVNSSIHIDAIHVDKPKVKYFLDRVLPQKDTISKGVVQLLKTIEVGEIIVENVELSDSLFSVKLIERHIEPRTVNLKGARVIVAKLLSKSL